MQSMQAFYTSLFSPSHAEGSFFSSLARIARAGLKDILAVRSALAWDQWAE